VNELIKIDAQPLVYDENGNLIDDGTYTYAYDEENRLIRVIRIVDSQVVGQYQYDALSRRVVKVANPTGVAIETRYFYDDARIIEAQNPAMVTQATYIYGNYIDEVLTMDRGGQSYYYHQNTQWSVTVVTDSVANVVERYAYDAYGCVTITDGAGGPVPPNPWGTPHSAIANPYIFTGRQLDEETGLYYYRARYYDCVKGRFLQRDPLGYVDGMNLYEYVKGNPINGLDPDGTQYRDESLINCLGYATGEGCYIAPDINQGESMQGMLKKLGWTCGKKGTASKDCECQCNEYMLMLYIYKYENNPNNQNPWSDPWIFYPDGKNDVHAIKCDNKPMDKEGKYKCSDGWSYVPETFAIKEKKVEKVKEADSFWKKVSVHGEYRWRRF
jgi:RHS repeat-associated protein